MMASKTARTPTNTPGKKTLHEKEKDTKLPQKANSRSSYNDSVHTEHNVIG